jgi:hypothetical protein
MSDLNLEFIKWAHKFCRNNRKSLFRSSDCGCFDCLEIFSPFKIEDWIDEDAAKIGQTARCPYCGVDSLIGDNDVAGINEEFLKEMNSAWMKPIEL